MLRVIFRPFRRGGDTKSISRYMQDEVGGVYTCTFLETDDHQTMPYYVSGHDAEDRSQRSSFPSVSSSPASFYLSERDLMPCDLRSRGTGTTNHKVLLLHVPSRAGVLMSIDWLDSCPFTLISYCGGPYSQPNQVWRKLKQHCFEGMCVEGTED